MAEYVVSRKIPSMDSYLIADQSGGQAYGAKHHHGMLHETWAITDAQGNEIATLTHDRKHLHATFLLNGQGLPDLTFNKVNFMPIEETWEISGAASQITVSGDLANYNWTLRAADGSVNATLQRKIVSLHRQYRVNVEGNPIVAIAMAIALDAEEDEHDSH